MEPNEIETHYETLRKRYGDETLLRQAAIRRTHLKYSRITFGIDIRMPLFQRTDREYRLTMPKGNREIAITLPFGEVSGLGCEGGELTAYYCLTRTRGFSMSCCESEGRLSGQKRGERVMIHGAAVHAIYG